MLGKRNQSGILAKYFSMYKKNPRSKVFAPLAESFRKLGMLDDAYKILKDGIRHHPNYALGYIVLANCYFDQGKFELTYNTLRPFVAQNLDNVSLQKIFAQACMNMGHLDEALETYKYLLFMNPRDKFFGEQVKKLEDDLHVGHKKLTLDQLIKAPDLEKLPVPQGLDDDWVQVNYFNKDHVRDELPVPESKSAEETNDEWVMQKGPGKFEQHPILKEESIHSRGLEDDFYADEFEEFGDSEEVNAAEVKSDSPIISHTLIDLYCAQKYYDKAIELLEKIIELNPQDQPSITKLKSVKLLRSGSEPEKLEALTEEDAHDELISIIETQVKTRSPKEAKIEAALSIFLGALKERASHYR